MLDGTRCPDCVPEQGRDCHHIIVMESYLKQRRNLAGGSLYGEMMTGFLTGHLFYPFVFQYGRRFTARGAAGTFYICAEKRWEL